MADLRRLAQRLFGRFVPGTPEIQEWEWYARNHQRATDAPLGDEWNDPAQTGLDVAPGDTVRHLDERLFRAFLGDAAVVLEIGAGGGRFTERLLQHHARVIAADTAPTMLALLRQRFGTRGGLELLRLDGRGLAPLADGTIDAVFSYDVFVHLPAWEIYNYLREIRRVLVPGGGDHPPREHVVRAGLAAVRAGRGSRATWRAPQRPVHAHDARADGDAHSAQRACAGRARDGPRAARRDRTDRTAAMIWRCRDRAFDVGARK